MDFLKPFIDFLFDAKRRVTHKMAMVFLTIAIIILLDNSLGFTYYHDSDNKIEQIEKISALLKDSTLPREAKSKLITIQNETLQREPLLRTVGNWIGSTFYSLTHWGRSNAASNQPIARQEPGRGWAFWNVLTGGLLVWITMASLAAIGIIGLINGNKDNISLLVMGLPFLFVAGVMLHMLLDLIPTIMHRPVLNYVLNVAIAIAVLVLISIWQKRKGKRDEIGVALAKIQGDF